jgi:oxygen-independent coproporphyrinogen-3 oxidase
MRQIKSLYMHFPFCKHLCNYCDFYKFVPNSFEDIEKHQKNLQLNYEVISKLHSDNGYTWGELDTLFLGGGTPSLWGVEGARYLKNKFEDWNISLKSSGENTVEFNPGSLDDKTLQSFLDSGFNRFSIGMQSLNPTFLKILDRIHSLEDCFEILKLMKKANVNYSIDLMIGLPYGHEKKRDVIDELKRAMVYDPSHFSVYILTVKENYLHPIPDEDYIADEYLKVSEFLNTHGFNQYEVSNFSKVGFESQHNLKYWDSESVAALGPSATGFLVEKRKRYKCGPNYQHIKIENLTKKEFTLEKIYMKLRTKTGISIETLEDRSKAIALRKKWNSLGLLNETSPEIISLNANGFLLIDSLINELI